MQKGKDASTLGLFFFGRWDRVLPTVLIYLHLFLSYSDIASSLKALLVSPSPVDKQPFNFCVICAHDFKIFMPYPAPARARLGIVKQFRIPRYHQSWGASWMLPCAISAIVANVKHCLPLEKHISRADWKLQTVEPLCVMR